MIPRLCFVTDGGRSTAGRPLEEVLVALARGGVGLIVLREREPPLGDFTRWVEALAPFRQRGLRLVVSRRLDLARAFDLDGVHLAADAVPVAEARRWLGSSALVGYSAHSGEEARTAGQAGASYVTLSPIYPTQSKRGAPARGTAWLAAAVKGLAVPALALGGVEPSRVAELRKAGAWGVAAVSALGAVPDPEVAARAFAAELGEA